MQLEATFASFIQHVLIRESAGRLGEGFDLTKPMKHAYDYARSHLLLYPTATRQPSRLNRTPGVQGAIYCSIGTFQSQALQTGEIAVE